MNRCNAKDEFMVRIGRITIPAIPSSNLRVWRLRSFRMVGIGRPVKLTNCPISSSVFFGLVLAGNNAWQWIMSTFVKHIKIVLLHFIQRSTKNLPFHLGNHWSFYKKSSCWGEINEVPPMWWDTTLHSLPRVQRRNPGEKSSLLLVWESDDGRGGGNWFVWTKIMQWRKL